MSSRRWTPAQQLAQRRQVEHVGEALPVGLHEDRERSIAARDGQQVGGPLALLPERRPGPRPASRQEQRPGGVLPEARGEQARLSHPANDQVLDLVGIGEQQLLDAVEARVAFRQPDGDAVVAVDRLDLEAQPLRDPRLQGHRPGRVHASAERGQDHQPPVAELIPEPFDHDPPVGRQDAGRFALVLEVGEQVLGGERIEVVVPPQALRSPSPTLRPLREIRLHHARELADGSAKLHRPPDRVAVPERQLARHPGCRRDGDPIGADVGHAPRAGTEDHDVAVHPGTELVDHLLVQLAHPATGRSRLTLEEHRVQAAVRDRAAAGHRHRPRVAPPFHHVRQPIPGDPRLELGELVGRIGAREHAQHALEDLAGQGLERGGSPHQREQLVDREPLPDRHRDQLLGQDVERVAREDRGLDPAVAHAPDDDGGLEQVAAVLGEDHALRRLPDLVPGPPDTLEAASDAGGALDLDDEIHGAHVDSQLETAGRDQRGEAPGLELLLDLQALLPGDAAVVGADEVLAGELVEALGEALREAATVGEHDRAPVLPDELQDPRVDRRPDAGPVFPANDRTARLLIHRQDLAEAGHVLDGHDDGQLQRLAGARVNDRDLATVPVASEEPGDGLEGPLRGAETDPLEGQGSFSGRSRACPQPLEALEAQRQVGAPLGAGDRVDLVHDHLLDTAQDLASLAREQQVQALRGRHQDVRWVPDEVPALVLRGVASPARDGDPRRLEIEALGGQRDPGQRRPQVAFHVVGQRLERADVERPNRAGILSRGRRARTLHQPVEAPQERGQGLAASRWCVDEGVAAGGDRGPPLGLGLRGRLERRLEPGPDGGPEGCERILAAGSHGTPSIGAAAGNRRRRALARPPSPGSPCRSRRGGGGESLRDRFLVRRDLRPARVTSTRAAPPALQ